MEAKVVAAEQEIKKAADAKAKASRPQPGQLSMDEASKRLFGMDKPEPAVEAVPAEGSVETSSNTPGMMEAADGGSPEVITHSESVIAPSSELSPEEKAIHTMEAPAEAGNGSSGE